MTEPLTDKFLFERRKACETWMAKWPPERAGRPIAFADGVENELRLLDEIDRLKEALAQAGAAARSMLDRCRFHYDED